MSKIKRRGRIRNREEKNIITGMIVSTRFCRSMRLMCKLEFLKIDYSRTVAKWIFDYFDKYNAHPGPNIQSIFEVESRKENLSSSEKRNIAYYLDALSENYEAESKINVDYFLDEARVYLERRAIEVFYEKGRDLVLAGRVKEARKHIDGFTEVVREINSRFDPFSEKAILDYFAEKEEAKLFNFDGALGRLIGGFQRGWLVSIQAPEKRGKSYFLQEMAFQAAMNGLNVVFFSLEMNDVQMKERIYKRITGLAEREKKIVFPEFDCSHNQLGTCNKEERKSSISLVNEDDEFPDPDKIPRKYKRCTVCRGKKKSPYLPAATPMIIKVGKLTPTQIREKVESFVLMFGKRIRVKTFPAFTAGYNAVMWECRDLAKTENFVADVAIVDYLDISGEERGDFDERGNINRTWKQFKRAAAENHILMVTADQSTKKSREKRSLTNMDVSEDKRKDGHLDVKIGINQTAEEKRYGAARISVLLHRHSDFGEKEQVLVLQSMGIGNPFLDSERMPNQVVEVK